MKDILFSIIVVCLNPGEKLKVTLESILAQTEKRIEIIVKDGNSTDGSAVYAEGKENVRYYNMPDKGIYDAMNQAAAQAKGEFLYFLNCGDVFHSSDVLEKVSTYVESGKSKIYYGNIYSVLTDTEVPSNPKLDAFGCYRNVPCHQACFYQNELFLERGYLLQYRVRADYEHFLWCFFEKEAKPCYMPLIVADYEGAGFSETKENRAVSAREHKEITAKYMKWSQRFKFRMILLVTLAPLRSKLAESRYFSAFYNALKKKLYK